MAFETVQWTFYGYVTPAGGKDVQNWFDDLPEESRDEARLVLDYLRVLPNHSWAKPQVDAIGDDIIEIRFKVSVEHEQHVYRIYGAYWPEGQRYSFTFLIGKDKKVKNDKRGKKEAVKRLKSLKLPAANEKKGAVHEFDFSEKLDRAPAKGQGGPRAIH